MASDYANCVKLLFALGLRSAILRALHGALPSSPFLWLSPSSPFLRCLHLLYCVSFTVSALPPALFLRHRCSKPGAINERRDVVDATAIKR